MHVDFWDGCRKQRRVAYFPSSSALPEPGGEAAEVACTEGVLELTDTTFT